MLDRVSQLVQRARRNPKAETRRPKEGRNPNGRSIEREFDLTFSAERSSKSEGRMAIGSRLLRISAFGFRPSFGLRASGFGFDLDAVSTSTTKNREGHHYVT